MNYTKHTTEELINIKKSMEGNITTSTNNPQNKTLTSKITMIDKILKLRNDDNIQNEIKKLEHVVVDDFVFNADYHCAKKFLSKYNDSRRREIEFTLTIDEFKKLLQKKRCYYTGIRLSDICPPNGGTPLQNYRTFDRIDSSKGYTKSNTVVCIHKVNEIKNMLFEMPNGSKRLTPKQMKLFINKIK